MTKQPTGKRVRALEKAQRMLDAQFVGPLASTRIEQLEEEVAYWQGLQNSEFASKIMKQVELDKLQRDFEFREEREAARYQTLWNWAHRDLDEAQKKTFFDIVANGNTIDEKYPPYARIMNTKSHEITRLKQMLGIVEIPAALSSTE